MQWLSTWGAQDVNTPQDASEQPDVRPVDPTQPMVDEGHEVAPPKRSLVGASQVQDRDERVFLVKKEGRIRDEERAALEQQYKLGGEQRQNRSPLVIDPRRSKVIGYWDSVAGFALLFTATVTPFEVGFLQPPDASVRWTDGLFLLNRMIDLIFIVDMALQFCVAYQVHDARSGTLWVLDHRRVVWHYMCSRWFLLDVVRAPKSSTSARCESYADAYDPCVAVLHLHLCLRHLGHWRLLQPFHAPCTPCAAASQACAPCSGLAHAAALGEARLDRLRLPGAVAVSDHHTDVLPLVRLHLGAAGMRLPPNSNVWSQTCQLHDGHHPSAHSRSRRGRVGRAGVGRRGTGWWGYLAGWDGMGLD